METRTRSVLIGYRLVTLFLVLVVGFGAVIALTRASDLRVPVQINPAEIGKLPAGLELSDWPDASLKVADPTTKQVILYELQVLASLALLVAGLWLVRAFLRGVLDGDPFGGSNVRRLRALGGLLLVGAPLVALVNYGLRTALFDDVTKNLPAHLGSEGYVIPGAAIIGGIGAYVLAEVFAYGMALREDVEATV